MQTFPTTAPAPITGQPRPRRGASLAFTLAVCALLPATGTLASTQAPGASSRLAAAHDDGAGPDTSTPAAAPSGFHGNWRVVARDDPHGQAVMLVSIQHSPGERRGTGDYAPYQPFCDLLAHAPIAGTGDCEAIDAGDAFERVQQSGRWLVLLFRPTADGQPHTLAVRRAGTGLVGEYRNGDGARAVQLERVE